MTKPKGGLGRGLEALVPSYAPEVRAVEIAHIAAGPYQPRTYMDQQALAELAESIRQHGVLQPLLLSRATAPQGGPTYRLIAGQRRLQAARMAGLERVPAVILEATPGEQLELALVENLQRADLTPLEEAQAYRRLVEEFGLTQEQVAQRVGRSRAAVANTLRLLSLSPEIQESLARGEISAGHARALLSLPGEGARRRAWLLVRKRGLSVRQTEELVRWGGGAAPAARAGRPADAETAALEERLRQALGTRVRLTRGRRGGRLTIHFYSDEELEAILGRLLGPAPWEGSGR